MAKRTMYAVAIQHADSSLSYVTDLVEHHVAYWRDNAQAVYVNKEWAEDIVRGLCWNGFNAFAVLKLEWQHFGNGDYEHD